MARKKDKKKIGFALFLLFTMVFSSVGFLYSGGTIGYNDQVESSSFRGHDMLTANGVYQVSLDDEQSLTFYQDPNNLVQLPYVEIDKSQGKVYSAYSPDDDLNIINKAITRLDGILRFKSINTQRSCLGSSTDCTENVPLVDCDSGKSIVHITFDNETSNMFKDGSCVVIQGDASEIDQFLDRIIIEEVL